MDSVPDLVADELRAERERALAVAAYLPTVAAIARMVDYLGALHAELPADDRLQQVLHSLGFVWEYVEAELRRGSSTGQN